MEMTTDLEFVPDDSLIYPQCEEDSSEFIEELLANLPEDFDPMS